MGKYRKGMIVLESGRWALGSSIEELKINVSRDKDRNAGLDTESQIK